MPVAIHCEPVNEPHSLPSLPPRNDLNEERSQFVLTCSNRANLCSYRNRRIFPPLRHSICPHPLFHHILRTVWLWLRIRILKGMLGRER
jgi:hypothetical protein